MKDYRWIPGQGPDRAALLRLRSLVRVPKQPMGEAWFMGETRRMYPALMHDDPLQWPRDELDSALYELASGPIAFGPSREWSLWFAFLLPRALELVGRSGANAFADRGMVAALVTAACAHYPDPDRLAANLRRDLLDTLGRAMFAPPLWSGTGLAADAFCAPLQWAAGYGDMLDPGDAFAASCVLVAKYLDPDRLAGWVESTAAIADPLWRAGWVVWLAAAAPMTVDGVYPRELGESAPHRADWLNAHLLQAPSPAIAADGEPPSFVDAERRYALQTALRRHLDRARLRQWGIDLRAVGAQRKAFEYALWQYDCAAETVAERYRLD